MREVLIEKNHELLRDIDDLLYHIRHVNIPQELKPFNNAVEQVCLHLQQTVQINLAKLSLPDKVDLVSDIISDTANALFHVRQMSELLVPALVRDPFGTHLSLKVVTWLHQSHPQTRHYPPVVTDGSWGIMPFALPIYYVPLLQQRRLLYQPLLVHEFGHQLYRHHKLEMDELVKEFQHQVLRRLNPLAGSNDDYYEEQIAQNQVIAFTWYKWIQELFCDAVGFRISGPSYLKAFSACLGMMRKGDFHLEQELLIGSSHPVTWLRVQFLAHQARIEGLGELAQSISEEWRRIAKILGGVEDYYGVYDEILKDDVLRVLDDMMIEADPLKYEGEDMQSNGVAHDFSPIWLLNKAWEVYEDQPDEYQAWEQEMIAQYLQEHTLHTHGKTMKGM